MLSFNLNLLAEESDEVSGSSVYQYKILQRDVEIECFGHGQPKVDKMLAIGDGHTEDGRDGINRQGLGERRSEIKRIFSDLFQQHLDIADNVHIFIAVTQRACQYVNEH